MGDSNHIEKFTEQQAFRFCSLLKTNSKIFLLVVAMAILAHFAESAPQYDYYYDDSGRGQDSQNSSDPDYYQQGQRPVFLLNQTGQTEPQLWWFGVGVGGK